MDILTPLALRNFKMLYPNALQIPLWNTQLFFLRPFGVPGSPGQPIHWLTLLHLVHAWFRNWKNHQFNNFKWSFCSLSFGNSELNPPPMHLEFQTVSPLCLQNSSLRTPFPPPPQNSKMPLMVWFGNFLETAMDLAKHCWTLMLSEPWRRRGMLKLLMKMMFRFVFYLIWLTKWTVRGWEDEGLLKLVKNKKLLWRTILLYYCKVIFSHSFLKKFILTLFETKSIMKNWHRVVSWEW